MVAGVLPPREENTSGSHAVVLLLYMLRPDAARVATTTGIIHSKGDAQTAHGDYV